MPNPDSNFALDLFELFDKQDEMDQERFNYNLREAEREIRLLKEAAGNIVRFRKMFNSNSIMSRGGFYADDPFDYII